MSEIDNKCEFNFLQELKQLEEEIKKRDILLNEANFYLEEKLHQLAVAKGAYRAVSSVVEREKVTDTLLDLSHRILKGEETALAELKIMKEEYDAKHKKLLAEANRVLDQRLYALAVLKEAYHALVSILDRQEVIRAVLSLIEGVVPYDFCGLLIVSGEKDRELLIDVKTPAGLDDVKDFKKNVFQCFSKHSGKKICVEKVRVRWHMNSKALLGKDNPGSELNCFRSVVLLGKHQAFGLLSIGRTGKKEFTEEETKLLSLIGTQAALGIENAMLHEKAREMAITDELTNFFTRRHFQVCLDEEVKRCGRYSKVFSLAVLDLDNFKEINDNYGHLAGDKVISKVTRIIKNSLRDVDVVGRYGGEEFAVIMPETIKTSAMIALERLRKNVEEKSFNTSRVNPIKLTLSAGVASFPADGDEALDLFKKADQALYKAKAQGKNCICEASNNGHFVESKVEI